MVDDLPGKRWYSYSCKQRLIPILENAFDAAEGFKNAQQICSHRPSVEPLTEKIENNLSLMNDDGREFTIFIPFVSSSGWRAVDKLKENYNISIANSAYVFVDVHWILGPYAFEFAETKRQLQISDWMHFPTFNSLLWLFQPTAVAQYWFFDVSFAITADTSPQHTPVARLVNGNSNSGRPNWCIES